MKNNFEKITLKLFYFILFFLKVIIYCKKRKLSLKLIRVIKKIIITN